MDLKPLNKMDPRLNDLNQNFDTVDHDNFRHHHGSAQWNRRSVRLAQPVNYFGGPNPTLAFPESTQYSARHLSSGSALPTASSSTLKINDRCYVTGCYEKIFRVLEARKHSNTLYSAEVISMDEMEEIQALERASGRSRGAKLLLDTVQKHFFAANPERRLQIMSALIDSFNFNHQQHLIKFLNPSYLITAVQPTAATAIKKKPNINQRVAETGPNFPVNTRYPCQITDRSFDDKHNINMPDIKTLSISEGNSAQFNRFDAQSRACEHEEISSKPDAEEKYPVQETNYDAKP